MSALWRGSRTARLRIASGLVLFVFVFFHMVNLGLVLASPEIAGAFQDIRGAVQSSLPGQVVLYGALLVHAALALIQLAKMRRLRMPASAWIQLVFGLAIPFILIPHIVFTRASGEIYGTRTEIGYIAGLIWDTRDGYLQALLVLLVWVHGCIGMHMWLRLTSWWQDWLPVLSGLAVLVPSAALAGYLAEGRRVSPLFETAAGQATFAERYNMPDGDGFAALYGMRDDIWAVFYGLLALVLVGWTLRRLLGRRGRFRIRYVGGPEVLTAPGPTLLEISRANGIPHAALCGGRGRCSTCRVIVEDGADQLPPPSEAEARTLAAAKAPPAARLACQIRPTEPMTVFRVFRGDGRRDRDHASHGEERRLAILFLDIRGFTSRTAGQLPYDVVFLLNRFFDAIVPQITGCGGIVDKYLGDGLLAVFDARDEAASARNALRAAAGIGSALATFNTTLRAEGAAPVRIGIGVHLGDLVLGEIGAAGHAPRTIIGDTVNSASRLEGETKTLAVELLVSGPLLRAAGHDTAALPMVSLTLRGRDRPLDALPVARAARLDTALQGQGADAAADPAAETLSDPASGPLNHGNKSGMSAESDR